jgi:hypothetical protein
MQLEIRNADKILVGKPEEKRPLRRPRDRWKDNIKMGIRETGFGDVERFIWLRIGTCCRFL